MNKEWSEKNKKVQLLLKKNTFLDGIHELIELRTLLMQEIDSWKYEVEPEDYHKMPFVNSDGYHSKNIAYSIWHIIRIEDIVVNTLILNREEVYFSGGFYKTINSSIITTGNELRKKEIENFTKKLDLGTLFAYAWEVKKTTDEWLSNLTYSDLSRTFTDEDKQRIRDKKVVSEYEDAVWLIDYWCDKDIKGLLKMPISRHWIMHVEAAIRIKTKLEKANAAKPRLNIT